MTSPDGVIPLDAGSMYPLSAGVCAPAETTPAMANMQKTHNTLSFMVVILPLAHIAFFLSSLLIPVSILQVLFASFQQKVAGRSARAATMAEAGSDEQMAEDAAPGTGTILPHAEKMARPFTHTPQPTTLALVS